MSHLDLRSSVGRENGLDINSNSNDTGKQCFSDCIPYSPKIDRKVTTLSTCCNEKFSFELSNHTMLYFRLILSHKKC